VPTKATYERFETSPDLEFDHFLTEKLGWGSVERMRRSMPAVEWQAWWVYYGRKAQKQQLQAMTGG
jgi:hypothetical protein